MSRYTIEQLRQNMDDWVKEMHSKVTDLSDVPTTMVENTNNIQHNYELVNELRTELDDVKQELKLLKLMQIANLKRTIKGQDAGAIKG